MLNAYQRRSKNVFDTAWTVFAECGVSDANWSRCIYIQKGSAFFKYYLKILIRMAIMQHTRAKTELLHGRPNLLQSVINTAKQLGKCNHLSKLSMLNAYQRRSKNVFDTAWTVFAECGVSDANWSRCIYIQKGSAFFKYYLKILIRMAIMQHTRAKTELLHGRPNLLQSVINTAKQLGKCNHLSS